MNLLTPEQLRVWDRERARVTGRGTWQRGVHGNADVVAYNGEDVSPVAYVGNEERADWIAGAPAREAALIETVRLLREIIMRREDDDR